MSPRYEQEIADLREWFGAKLGELPVLHLTMAQYGIGVDSLEGEYAALMNEAFQSWLDERSYELSYNQMCIAFFSSACAAGKLKVEAVQ